MRLILSLLPTGLLSLAMFAVHPAAAQSYGYGDDDGTLRCESGDGRTRQCPADTSGGVRLSRQLSRSPCIEGQTWGWDRRGIWVGNGCRGEFNVW
jgi:hypothetical protein